MKNIYILFFLASFAISSNAQIFLETTVLDSTTIVSGFEYEPWEIQWGPDDHIWMTEKVGYISRVNPETGEVYLLRNLNNHADTNFRIMYGPEGGLLGMALHPDFENKPFVYVFYSYAISDGPQNYFPADRLSRFEYSADDDTLINENVLIDSIVWGGIHDGARVLFLPDTTLIVSTGDASAFFNDPQDINTLNGKILRLNDDGSVPEDNPFPDNYVYSYGHRNPQGLALGPLNYIYSCEHNPGPDGELNIVELGGNYGWPDMWGTCEDNSYSPYFTEQLCDSLNYIGSLVDIDFPPSDMIWYDSDLIPEFENSFLVCGLGFQEEVGRRIKRISINPQTGEVIDMADFFHGYWGRLRDICQAPDGRIFLINQLWNIGDVAKLIELKPNFPVSNKIQRESLTLFNLSKVALNEYTISISTSGEASFGFSLMDMNGRILDSKTGIMESCSLNLNHLTAGMYILRLESIHHEVNKNFKLLVE